jgi:hypothetical protein
MEMGCRFHNIAGCHRGSAIANGSLDTGFTSAASAEINVHVKKLVVGGRSRT